ncbi:CATRA conflict system CASPASE/TPR repeat-associated protein [Micromonospora sicca]|uniref:CATRA conflict system CASPASE/TPR repeat-associated protein n=2 Tax=Micromonospora sicca TaxID=2202420 RepID=A0ABU5JHI2_9ACTN|nr:CATRA conflict system CASPASE/TPR repeat-associated protein [Micromonospora sp. 4G53]MDZ5491839.1 CATRA conflict system CASPASE/TPR repeat-associated protein [Micromonospora sp. 4G53]
MTPRRPALIVHTFFSAVKATGSSGPAAPDPTTEALLALWRGVARLDMDEPIAPYPRDLPRLSFPGPVGLEVLAARQRVVPGAMYEALAYRRHDILGVSVLLAPNDDGVGWQALSDQWSSAAPATCGTELSTATIYLGLSDGHRISRFAGRVGDPATWAKRLRRHVPEPPDEPNWATSWCRVADRLLMWELPADEGYGQRRQLIMADLADERVLDSLTWLSDGQVLPPLTRYLLYVAELQHQQGVLETAVPELRAAVEQTERACGTLADLLSTTEPSKRQLREAALDLATVQAQRRGLVWASADASTMAGTVRGIQNNMEAALGRDLRCRSGGPLDRDRECAVWLAEQIRIELAYLDAAWRRADQIGGLAAAVIDDRQRRQQEGLVLLQTSILGGLLMALATIQSLQYRVPLAGPLVPPLVCVLGILALVLPAAVLHWPRSGGPLPRRRWFGLGGMALGAAVGWLAASIGWWLVRDVPAPPIWSVVLAAVGAAVITSAAVMLTRPRSP